MYRKQCVEFWCHGALMHTFNIVKNQAQFTVSTTSSTRNKAFSVYDYLNSEDRNCIYAFNVAFAERFRHGILFNAVIICKTYMFRGLSFTK
jgi:hypothetical protein